MSVARAIKLTGVYIIGVIIIAYGIYSFMTGTTPQVVNNPFYLMFGGLIVTTAGSIYGHSRIAGPGTARAEEDKIKATVEDKKAVSKHLEELKKLEEEEKKRMQELAAEEEKEKKKLDEIRENEEKERLEAEKAAAAQKKKQDKPEAKKPEPAAETKETKEAKKPASEPIKIIICPSCGEENKYTAKFCDNCGKKLRP